MALAAVSAPEPSKAPDLSKPPEGFEQASGDLAGYWESASPASRQKEETHGSDPVLFTPLWVTLSDSELDSNKSSTLLHARLEAPCKLRSAVKEEGYKEFPAGTMFGIWTKPGMKPLASLGGAQVWMRNGIEIRPNEVQYFKEIGKPSPMVVFDIRNKGAGSKLKVRDDRREKSLPDKLRQQRASIAEDLGDIPF
jgi:hypothetical protein